MSTNNNNPPLQSCFAAPTSAIVLAGDWHIGAAFSLPENNYSIEIARQRALVFANEITAALWRYPSVQALSIVWLGDQCQNELIRPGSALQIECNITDQTKAAASIMRDFVLALQDSMPSTTTNMYGVCGNHTRVTRRVGDSDPAANYDNVAYDMVEMALDQEVIREQAGWVSWKQDGLDIEATHGHVIRGNLGIPAYGIQKVRGDLATSGRNPDLLLLGHTHNYTVLSGNGGYAVVNGSMMGPDPYAHSRALSSQASQTLLLVNRYGVVGAQEIRLGHIQGAKKRRKK